MAKKNKKMKRETVCIRLPKWMLDDIKKLPDRKKMSMGRVCEKALIQTYNLIEPV